MTDIKAFALQDLFGAGFYHLLLGGAIALLFGSAAAGSTVLLRHALGSRVTAALTRDRSKKASRMSTTSVARCNHGFIRSATGFR